MAQRLHLQIGAAASARTCACCCARPRHEFSRTTSRRWPRRRRRALNTRRHCSTDRGGRAGTRPLLGSRLRQRAGDARPRCGVRARIARHRSQRRAGRAGAGCWGMRISWWNRRSGAARLTPTSTWSAWRGCTGSIARRFFAEAARCCVLNGVLVAWGHRNCRGPARAGGRANVVLGRDPSYWPPQRWDVDAALRRLRLPVRAARAACVGDGGSLALPRPACPLRQLLASQRYRDATGRDIIGQCARRPSPTWAKAAVRPGALAVVPPCIEGLHHHVHRTDRRRRPPGRANCAAATSAASRAGTLPFEGDAARRGHRRQRLLPDRGRVLMRTVLWWMRRTKPLALTTLGRLDVGAPVNLERAMLLTDQPPGQRVCRWPRHRRVALGLMDAERWRLPRRWRYSFVAHSTWSAWTGRLLRQRGRRLPGFEVALIPHTVAHTAFHVARGRCGQHRLDLLARLRRAPAGHQGPNARLREHPGTAGRTARRAHGGDR